jgi:ribosomal protein L40E
MELFDNVKDTAIKTAKIVKEKSTELYEITKLSFGVNELEAKIDKQFKNAGMLIYRDYENDLAVSDDIKLILEDIDEKFKEIETIKEEINRIKNVSVCEGCGKTNPNDANFCLHCGNKIK